MVVRLESDLRGPVVTWLEEAGFQVQIEVPILWRRADVVGSREGSLTAVEMKLHHWRVALRQAMAYQLAADCVWVAMPLGPALQAYRQRWKFEAEGIGLIAVDDMGRVRCPIVTRPSPRLLPFLRARVLEDLRAFDLLLRRPIEEAVEFSTIPAPRRSSLRTESDDDRGRPPERGAARPT